FSGRQSGTFFGSRLASAGNGSTPRYQLLKGPSASFILKRKPLFPTSRWALLSPSWRPAFSGSHHSENSNAQFPCGPRSLLKCVVGDFPSGSPHRNSPFPSVMVGALMDHVAGVFLVSPTRPSRDWICQPLQVNAPNH